MWRHFIYCFAGRGGDLFGYHLYLGTLMRNGRYRGALVSSPLLLINKIDAKAYQFRYQSSHF